MEWKDEKGRPVVNGWHLELSHIEMDGDHSIKKAMVRGTRYGRNGGSFAQWVKGLDYRPLWVDVKLRPPALGEMVLVTIHGSDIIQLQPGETLEDAVERNRKGFRRVTIGMLDGEEEWTGADGWPMVVKPVAWAPLPEPWEEEEDETDSTTNIDEGIVRVVCQYHVNVDEKELVKALDYDRGQYQQGEWDMFELVTSAWYGKQMYFREGGGMVYSRVSHKTMQQNAAVNEFLEMIGE